MKLLSVLVDVESKLFGIPRIACLKQKYFFFLFFFLVNRSNLLKKYCIFFVSKEKMHTRLTTVKFCNLSTKPCALSNFITKDQTNTEKGNHVTKSIRSSNERLNRFQKDKENK
ncbi:hypothetical protein AAHE18_09G068900 [Arachis hypogaea]